VTRDDDELAALTATAAVAALGSGELGLVEYVEALLRRTERLEHLNVYITHDADAVLDGVRSRQPVGPLHGLPIGLKDSIDTADFPTTAGTPALAGWRPKANAPVAQALIDAGATITGKLSLAELSSSVTNNNAHFGPVGNPYAPDHIPGGSSGGTAAAVSAGLVAAGLGGDTGGSCRIPAALCGCVGMRPTLGRYSQRGLVPISSTRDTAGALARTVADARLIDGVCAGRALPAGTRDLRGTRLGVPRTPFYDDVHPATAEVTDRALVLLADHGAELVEVDLAGLPAISALSSAAIPRYEAPRELAMYLLEHGADLGPREVIDRIAGPAELPLWTHQLGPEAIDAATYREALTVHRPALQRLYATCFAEHAIEALVVPTTPLPAVPHRPPGEDLTVELNGRTRPLFPTYIRHTDPPSGAGLPALSLPAGLTGDGLPVGIELVGPAGSDNALLDIAEAFEVARGPLPGPAL
jgi:indoleacetamide hydrolase